MTTQFDVVLPKIELKKDQNWMKKELKHDSFIWQELIYWIQNENILMKMLK